MSEQGNAGVAAIQAAPEAVPQGAAIQAPSGSPSGQQNQQGQDDQFFRYPKNMPGIQAFQGRYGEADKALLEYNQAKQGGVFTSHAKAMELAQRRGYQSVGDYLDAIEAFATAQESNGQQQQGQQPVAAQDPEDQPMTLKQFRAMQAQEREEHQKAQTAASRTENRQREDQAIFKSLDELGYKLPQDGQDDPRFEVGLAAFDRLVAREKMADFRDNPGWPDSLRQMKRDDHMTKAATNAQVARATARFKTAMQDHGNQAIADFAQGQQQIPSATLAGGAGGSTPAKKFDQMAYPEKVGSFKAEMAKLRGKK
jgi:hypothetical protein